MVEFPDKNIYLYSGSVDFRKGIKSLSNLVSINYPDYKLTNSLFIFFSKDKRQVKILEIEDDDIWLYHNRLNDAKFVFPSCDKTIKIDSRQLKLILKTVELISHKKMKYNVIHADETPLKVIGTDKDKCYMFVYASSFWDSPIYIYDFNDSRNTDKFKELLKDYKGYIVCDGYAGYDGLKKNGIKLQRCFVHARRYFIDVLKVLDEPFKSKSPAYKVVDLMAILFKYESEFIDKNYTADMIKKARNAGEYSKAIKDLDDYIYSINTNNNSLLEKAINYYKNHKQDLYTYLDNGYLDMSNNLAERVAKPFVIARKNFLFYKTADGATTTGKLFSIVQTAKANGLKSEEYLTYVINKINKVDIDDLLPFSNKLPKQLLINK